MIFLSAIFLLVAAPFALIVVGGVWLWLGHKLLCCIPGR